MSRSQTRFRWARRLQGLRERAVDPTVAQRLKSIENRLQHLEAMLEGLQDAVHRESVRQGKQIDQLEKKAQPAEMRRALGQDAREHGI